MINKMMSKISQIAIYNGWGYSKNTKEKILRGLVPDYGYIEITPETKCHEFIKGRINIKLPNGVGMTIEKEDENTNHKPIVRTDKEIKQLQKLSKALNKASFTAVMDIVGGGLK
jgi:hypothetical protein